MHTKSDSDATSYDASTPPRSPPRRPLYYVQSPSTHHDAEKMSYGSSPLDSPPRHYHCSPIHHSRESSTTRCSHSLKASKDSTQWRKMRRDVEDEDEDDDDDGDKDVKHGGVARFYVLCFVLAFVVLFSLFSLILWGASKPYKPKIIIKNIVFERFNIQAGTDNSGVPTDMLTMNSTILIFLRNPARFFGVHVSATPLDLYYFQLKIGSGQMDEFYLSKKRERNISTYIGGHQVPLYGGISSFDNADGNEKSMVVPLHLTFTVRSRAYVLGKLVKPKFIRKIRCSITYRSKNIGKRHGLENSCSYY